MELDAQAGNDAEGERAMTKICPFMSYPDVGIDADKMRLVRIECQTSDCMAWFPGWKGLMSVRESNKKQWLRKKGLMPEMERFSLQEALRRAGL